MKLHSIATIVLALSMVIPMVLSTISIPMYAPAQLLLELSLVGVDVSGGDVVVPHLYIWRFDGVEEQHLRVGWDRPLPAVGFALSVKSSWVQSTQFMVFRRRGATTVGQFDFHYGSRPAGWILVARYWTPGGVATNGRYLDGGVPDANVWQTIYVDYNASLYGNMYIYEKDVKYYSSPPAGESGLTESTEPLYIGARGDQTNIDDVRNVFNGYIGWFILWDTSSTTTAEMLKKFKTMIEKKIVDTQYVEMFFDPTFYDQQTDSYTDIVKRLKAVNGNPPIAREEDEEKWLWLIKNLQQNTKLTFKHLDKLPEGIVKIVITYNNKDYEFYTESRVSEYSIDLIQVFGSSELSNVTIKVVVFSKLAPPSPVTTIPVTTPAPVPQIKKASIFPDPLGVTGQAIGSVANKWASVRLTYVDVIANIWNIPGDASGQITLTVTKDSVIGEGSFISSDTATKIIGGQGFRYGVNIQGSYPSPHPNFTIPVKISELRPTKVVFNYSIDMFVTTKPVVVSYYLWIPKEVRSGGTQKGDLLVCVQMYRDQRTGKPAGELIRSEVMPIEIDGELRYVEFEIYVDNIDQLRATHTLVTFVSKEQYTHAKVGLFLNILIDKAIDVLASQRPELWNKQSLISYIVQMIDLFIEPYLYQGGSEFKWTFYEYYYEVDITLPLPVPPPTPTPGPPPALTTIMITVTETQTIRSTVVTTVTQHKTTTQVSEVMITVSQINIGLMIGLALVLFVIGIVIGYIVKRR